MYSYACSRTARSKVSGVLSDVMITILGRDSPARIRASTSRPVTFGIQISRNARSKLVCWILRNASAPSFTAVTAYPAFLSMLEMAKRVVRSSSATRIFAGAWMSSMEITLSDWPSKGPRTAPECYFHQTDRSTEENRTSLDLFEVDLFEVARIPWLYQNDCLIRA